ncbi:MAG: sugar transferase [Minisyncoccota bacterium]
MASYNIQKRLFDLVFGSLLALLALPVVLCIVFYIKCVSRGPVIFKQSRVGRGGSVFIAYKFRSMHVEAEGPLDEIVEGDERIIPGGRFLRSMHLDELPQLWNVLVKADMSLVGPRPRPEEIDHEWLKIDHCYLERRLVKPGITGPAQLGGRALTPEDKKKTVALENGYVSNWNIWRDFAILFLTVPRVLSRRGV